MNKPKHNFTLVKNLLFTGLVSAVAAIFMGASYFPDSDRIGERQIDSVMTPYTLKDGRDAEIKYEKQIRSFRKGVLLSGISQPSPQVYSYTIITATIKRTFGWDKVYRWIVAYPMHSTYFTKVDSLVLTGDDVFIKYTYIPAFPSDDQRYHLNGSSYDDNKNRNPFEGSPGLLVKYARFKETGRLRQDEDEAFQKIHLDTYKWSDRYIWDDVSKEEFTEAAQAGDVISLSKINSNGKFEFYSLQTRLNEGIVYYGKRQGKEQEVDYYDYYRKRIVQDQYLGRFLSAVKTGQAELAEEMLNKNPALIHSHDPDGMTPLHITLLSNDRYNLLPLLYKYKPNINAIDYKGRTPLQMALKYHADKTIVEDLKKKRGKVLWDGCRGQDYALNTKQTRSPGKSTNQNRNKGKWSGNDVYYIWIEIDHTRRYEHGYDSRRAALFTGRQTIIKELGLGGAAEPELSNKIDLILDNAHVLCATEDKSKRRISGYIVRISAPNLRKIVNQ